MLKRWIPIVLRGLLGLAFLATGSIGLFLSPAPPPDYPPKALAFLEALGRSGYFVYLLSGVQAAAGLALLLNQWTPLALAVLAPVTINIALFHLFLTPQALVAVGGPGIVLFGFNMALLWIYRGHYRSLLTRKTRP